MLPRSDNRIEGGTLGAVENSRLQFDSSFYTRMRATTTRQHADGYVADARCDAVSARR
ncbi:hypothetical protein BURKHO8Y_120128 [Burkholderia sp. 8Y]|nr:hypothetical protein BURKHO8Y_120128 [Burkholderia sp. 8Y]